ncbi:MAG: mannose-1-phosphate guanylyltransferase [Bacteroidales bacterium]|nr:mannose-1-phosphate guanylyltransferase [Bacteroidales bacterium]
MAGGVGSRLYPLSTPEHPKQFCDLLECGKSMIRLTWERFLRVDPEAEFWVVTSAQYGHFVREQLPSVPEDHILLEPAARNTAPCIAYASAKIAASCPSANIVVTPADAYVPDADAFAATLREALAFTASRDALVCVGIAPTRPETGYGYIHAPAASLCHSERSEGISSVVKVEAFKEKPDLATAERYLAAGGYFWNAGIFVWNVATILAELRTYAPSICAVMDRLAPSFGTPEEAAALSELFPTCEKISIDYAVMEKSAKVHMIPGRWAWSDLGSFAALAQITGKDYSSLQ